MTIEKVSNIKAHTADGAQTAFIFDFRVDHLEDMSVYWDGVEQVTGWTIDPADFGDESGGEVYYPVVDDRPPAGTVVTLARIIDITQEVDYTAYDAFPAETHEGALDKLCMIDQQLQEELNRCLKVPIGDDGTTDYTFPPYDPGKFLMWDTSEAKLTNSTINVDDLTTTLEGYVQDAQNAANEAMQYAQNAAVSEANAAYRAQDAANCAEEAYNWATYPEDQEVPNHPGEYSAYHWAQKAIYEAAPVKVSATAPVSPEQGDLWFKTDEGRLLIWYEDVDSSQWVQVGAII